VTAPLPGYRDCNRYSRIIIDEALRRGLTVEVVEPELGELRLSGWGRSVVTFESLSELSSAVAFRRCDHKPLTRHVVAAAGLHVAPGALATFNGTDHEFLEAHGELVVKPARGEQGWGITVGVTDHDGLAAALERARAVHPEVLLERRMPGDDLRVVVIGGEVVAASVRRPPSVVGTGEATVAELVTELSAAREAATGGSSSVPLDEATREVVGAAGYRFEDVLPAGERLVVRRTANLHTGGTMHDVTDELHPEIAAAAVTVADAIGIPVVGVDFIVPDVTGPDYVVIEANEQPGLANHEPRPTAERFVDLLFPESAGS
jgi:GNAT-family acetyltransferase (TIGR03103 family)